MQELDILYVLQGIDQEIDLLNRRLSQLSSPPLIAKEAREAFDSYQKIEEEKRSLRSQIKDGELEAETISEKIKKLQKELYSGKGGVKELIDKQSEMDSLQKAKRTVEDHIIELMETLENKEQLAREAKVIWQEKEGQKEALLTSLEKEKEDLETELKQLLFKREETAKTLPSELLKIYENLRHYKLGKAVVEVLDNKCGVCKIEIATKKLSEVKKRQNLVYCENCGRILYWKEKP